MGSSPSSSGVAESRTTVLALAASTDLLRELPLEIRCRFRADCSSSSKGFGRVEQGSEETARSRDNSTDSRSIWQEKVRWSLVRLSQRAKALTE